MEFSFIKKLRKKNIFHLIKRRYWNIKYKDGKPEERFIDLPFGKVLVMMNEDVGGNIYSEKIHEQAETKFIQRVVNDDWICIDIGANIGYFSLLLSSKAFNGQVVAVEPIKKNVLIIDKMIAKNKVSNIFVEDSAIDNIDGQREFSIMEDSAYSGFVSTGRKNLKETVNVNTITPNSLISKYSLTRIDLIKIDVEGSEMPIFEAFKDLILNMRPKYILSECNEQNMKNYGFCVENFLSLLDSYGYTPNFLNDDGTICEFKKNELSRIDNIVFTRK
jgi:FkbM family methyltransferase